MTVADTQIGGLNGVTKFMNLKIKILSILVIVNLIIVGKYFFDKFSIQCEPCLPNESCPPCQTDYMANIWVYLIIWNLVALGCGLIFMILKNKNVW